MTAPFFIQRQHVAVKVEGTEGTDSVPADADVIAPAFDVEWTPTFEVPERKPMQSSFSQLQRIAGERSAQITFATELKGSGAAGTAPTNLSAPFLACGLGETIVGGISVTYAPASQGTSTFTVETREGSTDGTVKIKKIVGARGTFVLEHTKGERVMVLFTFTGRYVEPTEGGAQFVSPAIAAVPEPFLNVSLSFQSVATLLIQALTVDLGNTVVLRNDVNEATGNFSAAITNRIMVGTIDPEETDLATINFWNQLTTNAEGSLTYTLGASAGNITTVTLPKTQITNAGQADRDGIRIVPLDLSFNQNVVAGDDEISIAFT